jgi:hypothetical protein
MIVRINNLTQGTNAIIDSAFPIGSTSTWAGSPPARNTFHTLTPLAVNQGDRIQIQFVTPAFTAPPGDISMNFLLFIE